jgi:Rrf2 family protein
MISKTALHAVKALAVLADLPAGQFAGAGAVARAIGAHQNYLGKLLQTLARQGVVSSQKGLGGGFRLARRPQEITLMEIVEPIDHVSRWVGCLMGRAKCSNQAPCAIHHRWGGVRDAYLAFLRDTTIADLSADHELYLAMAL